MRNKEKIEILENRILNLEDNMKITTNVLFEKIALIEKNMVTKGNFVQIHDEIVEGSIDEQLGIKTRGYFYNET